MILSLIAALTLGAGPSEVVDVGPLVRALWLIQRHGTADLLKPENDQQLKGILSKSLAKDGILTPREVGGVMEPEAFKTLSGADGRLDSTEIGQAVEAAIPESRTQLLPEVRAHADSLTTSFDLIDEPHRDAGAKLVDWIAKRYRPGEPLAIIVVCTGNSRRSMMGATMGNIAAAYHGMPEVRFFSGGTAPSAFNPRTIAALRAIGVEIEPTGPEAPRGEPETVNPVYRVRWGASTAAAASPFESIEFSKHFGDPSNPRGGFAALMVCGEADEGCPVVRGSALRISMPYLDPKIYDGGAYESAKYAERRDDIGRLMHSVMMQARRRVAPPSNPIERGGKH